MKGWYRGQTVVEIVGRAHRYMEAEGYSASIIERYAKGWAYLERFAKESGDDRYSEQMAVRAIADAPPFLHLPIRRLIEFDRLGMFYCRADYRYPCPTRFVYLVDGYRDHLTERGLKQDTKRCRLNAARKFLHFIDGEIERIEELLPEHVTTFLLDARENQAPKSVAVTVTRLRDFLAYLSTVCELGHSPENALKGRIAKASPQLPSWFTTEELAGLLDAAAASPRRPKMKTASVLLFITYGFRAKDVIRLSLDGIDWAVGEIRFAQSKSGEMQIAPMTHPVKMALLDYLKNERPESELGTVFLTEKGPHRAYADTSSIYSIITELCARAGIDVAGRHHGSHAIRHSLATAMMDGGTDYKTIGSVLGQSQIDSARPYLDIDIKRLRSVALEVPPCRL